MLKYVVKTNFVQINVIENCIESNFPPKLDYFKKLANFTILKNFCNQSYIFCEHIFIISSFFKKNILGNSIKRYCFIRLFTIAIY